MPRELPKVFQRTNEEDVRDDVEGVRGTSMAQRVRILTSLCKLAAEQVAQHRSPRKTLEWQDPLPAESEQLLARLRTAYRQSS